MKIFTTSFGLSVLLVLSLQAEDRPSAVDLDLPQPLDASFAETLWADSPFTRSVNLQETLQLKGMAYISGRPVATIYNAATKQSYLVTDEPNEFGWKLTSSTAGVDLNNSQVELKVGSESLVMHYQGQQAPQTDGRSDLPKSQFADKEKGKKSTQKIATSSLLGEQGRELFTSLSPEARGKFKDQLKAQFDKKPDMTPEQSSAYAQKIFARIKETDRPTSAGNSKPPKTPKPNRKKQGA
ncbi:hypothetical protein [Prosthecobacter dejongeii]|uniref:Uncharacterized protein n=1 Tax=Prosthecobacter dejongeii TaxID=48465 RepID=A0A7W7YMW8_9BACT|nr:hypothetical protein [Prosthecobacter dejongeii]MBB5039014.1 hypothetical protein [Prosthecobacter dejongeii]